MFFKSPVTVCHGSGSWDFLVSLVFIGHYWPRNCRTDMYRLHAPYFRCHGAEVTIVIFKRLCLDMLHYVALFCTDMQNAWCLAKQDCGLQGLHGDRSCHGWGSSAGMAAPQTLIIRGQKMNSKTREAWNPGEMCTWNILEPHRAPLQVQELRMEKGVASRCTLLIQFAIPVLHMIILYLYHPSALYHVHTVHTL